MTTLRITGTGNKLEKVEYACTRCGEPLDKSKAVSVSKIENEWPEVVRYTTPIHEFGGGDNRYYHGVCWQEEQEELDQLDREHEEKYPQEPNEPRTNMSEQVEKETASEVVDNLLATATDVLGWEAGGNYPEPDLDGVPANEVRKEISARIIKLDKKAAALRALMPAVNLLVGMEFGKQTK